MLATLVAVVRKMLEAMTGSAPSFFSISGTMAPQAPLILCVMHGALFDIDTGECISGPCAGLALPALPVRVERGYVMLDERVPLEEPADLGR
jgi:Rieske Fe-S protein